MKSTFDYKEHDRSIEGYFKKGYTIIYTDGSCWAKNKIGGFGLGICSKEKEELISMGPFEATTTSRMELQAILHAFKISSKNEKLVIFSDSQYSVNALNIWVDSWDLESRINGDLFKQIIFEISLFGEKPVICWIPGHRNIIGNEIADFLASKGRNA